MKLLSLDTETGGTGSDVSLLTLGMIVCQSNGDILDSTHIKMIPDDGIFRVTGQALSINKINLSEHEKDAIPYKKCGTLIYDFINKWSDKGSDKLMPLGKNVYFDIQQVCNNVISKNTWNTFVSYRAIELGSIVTYLKMKNKIPSDIGESLSDLCSYFGIDVSGAHDALFDSNLNIQLWKALQKYE